MNKIVADKDTMHWYGESPCIPCGQQLFSQFEFSLSEDWDGANIIAQFKQGDTLLNVDVLKNTCYVPYELSVGVAYLRLRGTFERSPETIATANELQFSIVQGFESGGSPSVPPSQDLYQVLLNKVQTQIGNLDDLTTKDKTNLVAAINEAAKTGFGGAGSISMRTADGYIQYSTDDGETWENLIAVADLKGEPGKDGENGKPGADGAPGKDGTTDTSLGLTSATPGQIAKITAVDDNGKPTAWEPVDMPSGGGIHDVSWRAWDNVVVPEGGLNAFDFTTLASGEKLSDHQVKGMFIYSPYAVSAAENEQTATLTVNGDYVFSLTTFSRATGGYLRLLLTVESSLLIVRYYKRDTDNRADFPATTVSINKEDLHSFSNLAKASTTIIGYGKTLKLFNRIESVRIESSGQVAKNVEFDVQVLY